MHGLCMMNADKQTFLTQTGPKNKTSGTTSRERNPGPQRSLQGNEHPSFQLGQSRYTDEVRYRSSSTGEVIQEEDGTL